MNKESQELRQLYLQDLAREVSYGGKTRPRARKVEKVWSNIESKYASHLDKPLVLEDYENVWVWSDIHFGHTNIIKYCERPFADEEEMNDHFIEQYNFFVGSFDLCIWVGDVSFMGAKDTNDILFKLNGDRILVVGNHDIDRKDRLKKLVFDETHLIYAIDDPVAPLVFTHYTMENAPQPWINIHGHVHNNPHDMQDSLRHINVSVEVLDYKPIHLDELKRIAKTRIDSMETI